MLLLTIIPVILTIAGTLGAGIFVLFKKFNKKESNNGDINNSIINTLNQSQNLNNDATAKNDFENSNNANFNNLNSQNLYENLLQKNQSQKNPLILEKKNQLIK